MKRLINVDRNLFEKILDLYWKWKELNFELKKIYPRGVNLHEGITEIVCCYVNNFELSLGGGSEDAYDPRTGKLVQVKGTSNWNSDLTSFGPDSIFNALHFVRLDANEDIMYLYDIPTENLDDIYVNSFNTVRDFKNAGKRPRFSIIKECIEPYGLEPYARVIIASKEIQYRN
ncbi:Bsp6I family type II restriction endonuclease [Clostridium thermobutyricum]|uniref:Bsp6I family type II restriction endonuclease n=1 Tax=Clostridium thermobutyricum TaxID=29372 RepID=UPI0018A8B1D2|nr:Bsp6I family type II restriction endonuclease [Clostridium thermobutyricum]MDO4589185.1 Bsp6I family type II restriction endonuclease [Fusobacterium sp.]